MPSIGLPELIVIGLILMLVFGGSRLPKLGEGLGRAAGKLRRAVKQDARIEVSVPPRDEAEWGGPGQVAPGQVAPGQVAPGDDAANGDEEPEDAELLDRPDR